jgi:hypothetical protein
MNTQSQSFHSVLDSEVEYVCLCITYCSLDYGKLHKIT